MGWKATRLCYGKKINPIGVVLLLMVLTLYGCSGSNYKD